MNIPKSMLATILSVSGGNLSLFLSAAISSALIRRYTPAKRIRVSWRIFTSGVKPLITT